MSTKVWIHGVTGKMGRQIVAGFSLRDQFQFCGGSGLTVEDASGKQVGDWDPVVVKRGISSVDAVIDFSLAEANQRLVEVVEQSHKPLAVLIGTTGLSPQQKARWAKTIEHLGGKLLLAPNTSIGVWVTAQLGKLATRVLGPREFDVELIETHHSQKKDAPSGTAEFLADAICSESSLEPSFGHAGPRTAGTMGVHAVRGGGVFGEHEIRFLGPAEEVTISHRAYSRKLFADGAFTLLEWLLQQKPGCYDLAQVEL